MTTIEEFKTLVDSNLLTLFYYLLKQQQKMFTISIYLSLGGRLIFIISYLIYLHYYKLFNSPNALSYKERIKNTCLFVIREVFYVLLGLPLDFIAVFVAGYSVLQSAYILISIWSTAQSGGYLSVKGNGRVPEGGGNGVRIKKITQINLVLIRIFSIFLNPIFYFGALLYVLSETQISSGNQGDYVLDSIFLVLAGISFFIMRIFKIDAIQSRASAEPTAESTTQTSTEPVTTGKTPPDILKLTRWEKIPMLIKVIGLMIIIITPVFIYINLQASVIPIQQEYQLKMSDGVHLRTRVYFPPGYDVNAEVPEKSPVILVRTPYNLEGLTGYVIQYSTLSNYIVVTQDLRGTYGSEGKFYGFLTDYSDGNETVNWILEQPWCNGKIASIGGSALGINQILYHAASPRGLKAASILVGTGEMYDYGLMNGGCLRQGLAENWLIHVGEPDAISKMLEHPEKDKNWENVSLTIDDRAKNIDVRAVFTGGWYDMFCQGTLDAYNIYNTQGTDYAKGHQILVMGPWSHMLSYDHLDISYPGQDGLSYFSNNEKLIIEEYFFNKAIDWANYPHVFYYLMGDPAADGSEKTFNVWKNATDWPIPATYTPWYLDGADGDNPRLIPSIPDKAVNASFIYDPTNPVKNGGGSTLTLEYIGAVDQRRVEYTEPFGAENRSDILKFTSNTLTTPLEITGRIRADLLISSNCTDTDFTAKLIDIFPDGKEMWIGEGILKTRYRNGFNNSEMMIPNEKYALSIDLWSTAYVFAPGHQIRLSISSSSYNKFAVNPNTGAPVKRLHPEDLVLSNGSQVSQDAGDGSKEPFYYANNSVICGDPMGLSALWLPVI